MKTKNINFDNGLEFLETTNECINSANIVLFENNGKAEGGICIQIGEYDLALTRTEIQKILTVINKIHPYEVL